MFSSSLRIQGDILVKVFLESVNLKKSQKAERYSKITRPCRSQGPLPAQLLRQVHDIKRQTTDHGPTGHLTQGAGIGIEAKI